MQPNYLLPVTTMVVCLILCSANTWSEELPTVLSHSTPFGESHAAANNTNAAHFIKSKSESLGDAVVRVNSQLAKEYSVLAPKMLTVASLRCAIQEAIEEFSNSRNPGSELYIATFTKILETNSISASTPFGLSVTRHRNNGSSQDYAPNEYINTVSINYCFSVPNRARTGIRIIGLPKMAEGFDIVRKSQSSSPSKNPGQSSANNTSDD